MPVTLKDIIALRHPYWTEMEPVWAVDEARYEAGWAATADLTPFQWETLADWQARRASAVFPDLQAEYAAGYAGELFSKAPEPGADEGSGADGTLDFGPLSARDGGWRADELQENADGVGPDSRAWDTFWREEMELAAGATDFRWIYVEAPPGLRDGEGNPRSPTQQDEMDGHRPYLLGLSPRDVLAWDEADGRFNFALFRTEETRLSSSDGSPEMKTAPLFHVLIREGYDGFGDEFKAGGWWVCNEDGEEQAAGSWSNTGGEIPLGRLYYRRPRKSKPRGDRADAVTLPTAGERIASLLVTNAGQGGAHPLGKIAKALMDYGSWADHDTFTSSKRQEYIGVDSLESAKYMAEQMEMGNPRIFYPKGEGSASFNDSGEVSANGSIKDRIETRTGEALRWMTREIATAPDASGRAREIEHAKGTSPRLVAGASNVEEIQTFAAKMLALRWVGSDEGVRVKWTRRFDLEGAAKALQPLVETLSQAGLSSPTVFADYVIAAMKESGVDFSKGEGREKEERIRSELGMGYERQRASLELERQGLRQDPDPEARAAALENAEEV